MRVGLLVLLLVGGCGGGSVGKQLGDYCYSTGDCATNLVCTLSRCAYDTRGLTPLGVTGRTGPTGATGTTGTTGPKCGASSSSCYDSSDCCSGYYCSASSSKCFSGCRDDRDDCTKDSDCCSGDCSASGYCQ